MATKKTAPKAANRFQALTADVTKRAKAAQANLAGRRAEIVKFGNENLAAAKASGKVVATGVKPLVDLAITNTRNQFQAYTASTKAMQGVKSPVELFKLQRDANKAAFDAARQDTLAFGRAALKLATDAAAPLKGRFAEIRKQAA